MHQKQPPAKVAFSVARLRQGAAGEDERGGKGEEIQRFAWSVSGRD